MKNKVVRKLLMVGLSSSVVLTSTVGVTAASMDATTTDVVVENAAEDEVLTPVEGEEAVTEETSEEVAEEETTEETGEEVAEEETTEDTEKQEEPTYSVDVTIQYTLEGTDDVVGTDTVSAGVNKYDCFAFKASDLTQVPGGYELCESGDISGSASETTITVYVREKAAETRSINVNYVDESGNIIGTETVEVPQNAGNFNASLLKNVPEKYALAATGDVALVPDSDSVDVLVRLKEKTIMVNYILEDGSNVGTGNAVVEAGANHINTSALKDVPYGYELASTGDINLNEGGNSVNIVVREKDYNQSVFVNYVDEDGNLVLSESIKVYKGTEYINTGDLNIPYGWEVAEAGDMPIKDGAVTVVVREKEYTKDVVVNYVDEAGNPVLTTSIKLLKDETYFNTSILKDVPYGWELATLGDVPVAGNVAYVVVREKEYTKDVVVNYVDEAGNPVLTTSIKLLKDETYFNTSILKDVPYGWEIANAGDVPVGDNNVATVVVREKEYTKDVVVNYVDEAGNPVLTTSIKLLKDETYFNTSILKDVPYGWEIANAGDVPVGDNNVATVVVREKEYTKDVVVNYVDEAGNPVLTTSIKLLKDETYFNTSILKDVPYGWILANVGDISLNEDGTATVVVRQKQYTRDVVINYVDEEGNNILTSGIKLDENATYFNTSILTDVPYGWEIAVVGDIPVDFETNSATVVVREKVYQRDVVINYVDEEGNNILTSGIKLDENATYFNTSILTDVPYGWEIAVVGDIPVDFETNSANVVVRQKKYTKDVTVKYVTEEGEEVGTGTLVVDEKDTYINTSILTDVPEGYVIAIIGDLPIEDNTVVVTVRAEKEDPEEPTPTPDPEEPTPTPDPEEPTPTPNPEDPDQPIDPENPTPTPDQNKPTVAPEKPNNNNNQNNDQNKADTNKSEVKTNNPKTGDATNTVPLVAGLLGSGSMIGLIQMLRRKKK